MFGRSSQNKVIVFPAKNISIGSFDSGQSQRLYFSHTHRRNCQRTIRNDMTNFRKLQNEELNRISTEAFKEAPKIPVVILLDNVRSQNNVGSVFRTSDAFPHRKNFSLRHYFPLRRTGKYIKLPWEPKMRSSGNMSKDTVEAVDRLKKEGYRIFAIEQAENTTSLENFFPCHPIRNMR